MIPAKIEYLYRVSINQSRTPEGLTVIFSYCLLIEGLSTIEKSRTITRLLFLHFPATCLPFSVDLPLPEDGILPYIAT